MSRKKHTNEGVEDKTGMADARPWHLNTVWGAGEEEGGERGLVSILWLIDWRLGVSDKQMYVCTCGHTKIAYTGKHLCRVRAHAHTYTEITCTGNTYIETTCTCIYI